MKKVLALSILLLVVIGGSASADRGRGRGRGHHKRHHHQHQVWRSSSIRVEPVRVVVRQPRVVVRPHVVQHTECAHGQSSTTTGYRWVEGRWTWNGYEWTWQAGYYEPEPSYVDSSQQEYYDQSGYYERY